MSIARTLAPKAVHFYDLSSHRPYATLTKKPGLWIHGCSPKQRSETYSRRSLQDGEITPRNSEDIGSSPQFPDRRSSPIKPPGQEVFLFHPLLRDWVISHGRWFVS